MLCSAKNIQNETNQRPRNNQYFALAISTARIKLELGSDWMFSADRICRKAWHRRRGSPLAWFDWLIKKAIN